MKITAMTAVPALPLDTAWIDALARRLDAPCVPARDPLVCAGETSPIGSIEPHLAHRMAVAGLPLIAEAGGRWRINAQSRDAQGCEGHGHEGQGHEGHGREALDASLAAIAHWLHDNGLGGRWRDELLPVDDAEGRRVAVVERAAVRALGIATHAVHLVGTSAKGEVWVQQRALDKAVDPGLWDTLMGGLVSAGESIADTLARETWEEAGLDVAALQAVAQFGRFTVRRPVPDGWMIEHIEMFEAVLPDGMLPVNQDGEVARFECLIREALIARLEGDEFTLEAAAILSHWL